MVEDRPASIILWGFFSKTDSRQRGVRKQAGAGILNAYLKRASILSDVIRGLDPRIHPLRGEAPSS
jgi:hypothetical protein